MIQNQAIVLPDHRNSPRLARDALVLGPSVALRDPSATPGVNNFSQTVPQSSWCLGVDSSKTKASL